MFKEMLFYHSSLVNLMVVVLILGGLIPFLANGYEKMVKYMRIYMFTIHTLFSMVAFSGLVAFAFAQLEFNLSIFLMVVLYIAISSFETLMYFKVLKLKGEMQRVNSTIVKYTLINLLLVVALIVWKMGGEGSAVPL
jgi:hypothetical protein